MLRAGSDVQERLDDVGWGEEISGYKSSPRRVYIPRRTSKRDLFIYCPYSILFMTASTVRRVRKAGAKRAATFSLSRMC